MKKVLTIFLLLLSVVGYSQRYYPRTYYPRYYSYYTTYHYYNYQYNNYPRYSIEQYKKILKDREKDSLAKVDEFKRLVDTKKGKEFRYVLIDTILTKESYEIPNPYGFKYKSAIRTEYSCKKITYSIVGNEYYYKLSFSKYKMFDNFKNNKEYKKPTSYLDIEWCFLKHIDSIYIDNVKYEIPKDKKEIKYYVTLKEILYKVKNSSHNVYIKVEDEVIPLEFFKKDVELLLTEYERTINQKVDWLKIK
jgi:hypothetical protein